MFCQIWKSADAAVRVDDHTTSSLGAEKFRGLVKGGGACIRFRRRSAFICALSRSGLVDMGGRLRTKEGGRYAFLPKHAIVQGHSISGARQIIGGVTAAVMGRPAIMIPCPTPRSFQVFMQNIPSVS